MRYRQTTDDDRQTDTSYQLLDINGRPKTAGRSK